MVQVSSSPPFWIVLVVLDARSALALTLNAVDVHSLALCRLTLGVICRQRLGSPAVAFLGFGRFYFHKRSCIQFSVFSTFAQKRLMSGIFCGPRLPIMDSMPGVDYTGYSPLSAGAGRVIVPFASSSGIAP